jgi:hypothetical protein
MYYKVGVKGVEIDPFRIASQFHDSNVFQMACGPHSISQIINFADLTILRSIVFSPA